MTTTRIYHILALWLLGVISPSYALTNFGTSPGDAMLTPPPPPKPAIFGIHFDDTPQQITTMLAEAGLLLEKQESKDSHGIIKLLIFTGIPGGLTVRDGTTHLLFFKNKLTRLDLLFTPSYRNFLVVRNQLFSSLGTRFKVNTEHASMDGYLRAKLAHLQTNEFDDEAEEAVKQSLLNGTTFFFYSIQDRRGELNINYSFAAAHKPKTHAQLLLHYSLKARMEEMNAWAAEQNTRLHAKKGVSHPILPNH